MTDKTSQEIHNYSRLALVGAAFAVTAWGSSGVIVKYISVTSTEIAIYRFTFYSIVMIAFLKARGTPLTFQSIKIAFWGGIALGLNVAFFFESLKRTTVVNATIIGSLQPVLISVYSYKVFKEKVSRRDIFIGVIALAATFGVVAGSSGTAEWDVTGDLFACAALFTWTAYFIISKQTQNRVSPLEFTAATGVITGILNFLIALIFSVALTVPSSRDIFWLFSNCCWLNWSLVDELVSCQNSFMGWLNPHAIRSSCIVTFGMDFSRGVFECSSDLLYLRGNPGFGGNTSGSR